MVLWSISLKRLFNCLLEVPTPNQLWDCDMKRRLSELDWTFFIVIVTNIMLFGQHSWGRALRYIFYLFYTNTYIDKTSFVMITICHIILPSLHLLHIFGWSSYNISYIYSIIHLNWSQSLQHRWLFILL